VQVRHAGKGGAGRPGELRPRSTSANLRIHLLFERPVLHDFATALTQLGVVIR
jgi:hypothetical protein